MIVRSTVSVLRLFCRTCKRGWLLILVDMRTATQAPGVTVTVGHPVELQIRATAVATRWRGRRGPVLCSHFSVRRKAYNMALARRKADLDAKKANPSQKGVAWTPGARSKQWDHGKTDVAPWWAENVPFGRALDTRLHPG